MDTQCKAIIDKSAITNSHTLSLKLWVKCPRKPCLWTWNNSSHASARLVRVGSNACCLRNCNSAWPVLNCEPIHCAQRGRCWFREAGAEPGGRCSTPGAAARRCARYPPDRPPPLNTRPRQRVAKVRPPRAAHSAHAPGPAAAAVCACL